MDDESKLLKDYEEFFKSNAQKPILPLYKSVNKKRQSLQNCPKPREIISNISLQLKAIQKADTVQYNRDVRKRLDKCKKTSFLPVTMLPKENVASQTINTNKFETQFELDTQLMDVIVNAEEFIDTKNCITQEFDSTFHEADVEGNQTYSSDKPVEINLPTKEILNKNDCSYIRNKLLEANSFMSKDGKELETTINVKKLKEVVDNDKKSNSALNNSIDEDIPCSYVFESIKKSRSPTPLVFDLNSFEDFEKIANPIIEENPDIKSAKQLINSQIVGRELLIQTDEILFCTGDTPLSPVLRITAEKLNINKPNESINYNSDKDPITDLMKDSIFLKDEIVFSSDEETEYIHKQSQDLSLTCALETSFYNHSQVLDKTMYVAFHTASNKSIQVCTESFTKAKSFLDVSDFDNKDQITLTELVEKFDSTKENKELTKSKKHRGNDISMGKSPSKIDLINDIGKHFDKNGNNAKVDISRMIDFEDDYIQNVAKADNEAQILTDSVKRKFDGFMTSNNKKIRLSEEALARGKQVFRNIDLDSNENKMTTVIDAQHIDEDIIHEFEQDMSLIDDKQEFTELVSKTASKNTKTSEVSDELNISQKLNSNNFDINCKVEENNRKDENVTIPHAISFKTASNKHIEIPKEALAKSKHILKEFIDIDVVKDTIGDSQDKCMNWDQPSTSKQHVCGFRTASHKTIHITPDALVKSKPVFQDIIGEDSDLYTKLDSDNNIGLNQPSSDTFMGFRTANNKKIKISEASYTKTKNMFNNIILCDEELDLDEKENKAHKDTQLKLELQEVNKLQNEICDDFNTAFDSASIVPKFEGFKTASNKSVMISEKAIIESKKLFADLDLDVDFSKESVTNLSHKSMYENNTDCDREVKIIKSKTCSDKEMLNQFLFDKNTTALLGFKTASNKEVNISETALANSKKLLSDLVDVDIENKCNDKVSMFKDVQENDKAKRISKEQVHAMFSFQTASNKPIQISDKILEQSKTLFKDIENVIDTPMNSERDDTRFQNFTGFRTANRKPIQVSAQALARSKALLEDIDDKNCNTNFFKESKQFKGFQTASSKPVHISAEALAKSKTLFNDIESNPITNLDEEFTFKVFQTASKKPVKISAEAIAKSKYLFEDIDSCDIKNRFKDKSPNKEPIFRGFETANRKPVEIYADALAKSKLLFQDIDTSCPKESLPKFERFKTGNNNPVSISEDVLLRSKVVLEDKTKSANNFFEGKLSFSGFETASKKKVLISDLALEQSRLLFQDINDKSPDVNAEYKNKENCHNNIRKTPFNFVSASNNKIEISQDSLDKSRRILYDKKHDDNNIAKNNLENLMDTQVINNFEETLYTEDFCKDTPKQSKRSGSPILSCPKPKRRKIFQTPYRNEIKPKSNINLGIESKIEITKESTMLFDEDYKKTKRYTLKDLYNIERNNQATCISTDSNISEFNFDNLLNYKFKGMRSDVTNTELSTEDVKDTFEKAVNNKKLIPNGWLDNHIRLIIWKLLSYEIKFPINLSGVCTVRNVLNQLKYRYEKELYNAERPALRKILERDDVAAKTMVLCVAAMYVDGVSVTSVTNDATNVELLLTDGWYCVKATIDKMLTKLVYDEKITVGCKIVTNGAELVNCEQGVAPWEDTSSVRLKIFGNSTRRARWDARLGYHGNAAILAPLSTVKVDGGKVSKLRLYVARVYPALFVEKFEDGSTVTRSERLQTIHELKYESERQTAMEKLYEEIEKEMSDQESQDSESSYNNKKRRLYDGSQLISSSPTKSLEEHNNKRHERIIQNIQSKLREKMDQIGLNVNRNVISLLKVRVAGVSRDSLEVTKGLMSIWKPNDAITDIIREGTWIEVMNVVPTAIRYSEIQISASRNSVFRESKAKDSDKVLPLLNTLKRKCYHIKELAKNPTMSTDYNEIDTVGFVFQIDPTTKHFDSSKQPFQNLYLTDAERNIICVNFWGGLKKFGYQNVLDTGQVVACVNLQKRSGNTIRSIPHYRVTEFSYFTKTPKNVEVRNIVEELVKKFSGLDKRKHCEECIFLKNNFNKTFNYNNENISPYRINNVHNLTKNKIFIDSPLAQKPVDVNLNLTGLDFESTFRERELSPQILLRKKKVNEKIAKLKMYGEPPPLSPIHIINRSKSALNSYKSPLTANVNVASVEKDASISSNEDCNVQTSPVLAMNRTYVKNVNPIKLNFSNVPEDTVDDNIDHFAEDFDASPPLSLD